MPAKKKSATPKPPAPRGRPPLEKRTETKGVSFTPELRAWLETIDPVRFTSAARRVLLDAMKHDRKPPA